MESEIHIDRIILFIIGIVLIVMNYKSLFDVAYLLVGLTMLMMTYISETTKYIKVYFVVCLVMSGGVFVMPYLVFFMPIIIHGIIYGEGFSKKNKIACASIISVCVTIEMTCHNAKAFDNNVIMLTWLLIVIAIIFGAKSAKMRKISNDLKRQRDDYMEYENALRYQNAILEKNTANEIHIATLAERNRIAREIHDNVGHMLSRSILQTGALIAIHKGEPVEKELAGLSETLNTAMNNIRESVHDLHKDSFDMDEAVRKVICELSRFEVKYECDMSNDANKNIKYAFITILGEAVTNINKYSNAKNVKIIISELDLHYQMLIEDDGKKTDNAKAGAISDINGVNAGIGLKNMQERIRNLNGIINITNNNGFRIFISVPKSEA